MWAQWKGCVVVISKCDPHKGKELLYCEYFGVSWGGTASPETSSLSFNFMDGYTQCKI